MRLLKGINLCLCWLGMLSCETPEQSGLLQENSTTRLIKVEPALSPEALVLRNKIAQRIGLQKAIDKAPKEQVQTINFACSAQSGGLVAYIREEQALQGLRLSLSQERGCRSTQWYYQDKKTIALVTHEQSQWQGDQEHIEQTVFYVEEHKILQVLHRVVQASPRRLEVILEQTPFERVRTTSQEALWAQLQVDEQQLLSTEEQPKDAVHFCP
ncbi:MAG: hypothetical protein ACRBFS_06680 [Aureispira sp.]